MSRGIKYLDFLEKVSRSPALKFKLAWLTFAGLVVPTALLLSMGIPEKYALPVMLVAFVPFQYAIFCVLRRKSLHEVTPSNAVRLYFSALLGWRRVLDVLNKVDIQLRWLLDLPGRLVAVVTLLGWLLSLVSATWLYVTAKNLKEVQAVKVGTTEMFNEQYFLDQKEDYERSEGVPEPFVLGRAVEVQKGASLRLEGTVKFPLGCPYYWILFLEDDLVWPKASIKNSGLQSQDVRVHQPVAVPSQFQRGKIVLACVSDETHKQFEAWLAEGRDAPLLRPSRLDVALATNIATREG